MAGESTPIVGRVQTDAELLQYNQASVEELRNVLYLAAGEFSLTLAACNYHRLRNLVVEQLVQENLAEVLRLPRTVVNLRETIAQAVGDRLPPALMVIGLDYLTELELMAVLQGANLSRDSYRQCFPFPLVLWMNRRVRQQFARYAPDFRSFAPAAINFSLPPAELLHSLQAGTNQVFANVLERGGDRELTTTTIRLYASDALRSELEFAIQDLIACDLTPDPELQASLDFLQGREAHSRLEMETAQSRYHSSLAFWEAQVSASAPATASITAADKRAVLWLHLGLWWRSFAVLQRVTYESSLRQARSYFEALLQHFRDTEQTLHLARFIHVLAEVQQKQRDWQALETLAVEGITLHREIRDPIRLARDHGFLAEVALIKEDWPTAHSEAQQALSLLETTQTTAAATPEDIELANALDIANSFQRGWYRFLLGEAQMHLSDRENALQYLEAARWETDPEVDLTLHLKVLQELIHHYFELGRYWEAFDIKQELRQVEYGYNLRAFIGAGAVQPHQRTASAKQFDGITYAAVAAEIRASGRLQDVEALVERLRSPQHAIIVIHGPSGVGKSSILSAGLLPALRNFAIGGYPTVPLLVQTYGNWQQSLAGELNQVLVPWGDAPTITVGTDPPPSPPALIELMRWGISKNRSFVIIFDQFEEFFFDKTELAERRPFYELLQYCIDLPFIKVVLALREDYLHHLLEAERIINRASTLGDLDLLSRDVRYALANFTPEAAAEVIRQLTTAAQYPLEPTLTQRLVADLAAETGDVRPIELQVVGAQLQREDINTLAQYEALGEFPKEKLVQDYLAYVVRDCGPPHERLAWVVLYLLTDEDREQRLYRPLKTREQIEYELSLLEMPFASEQLSMVLSILVGSGLVFQIPEEPDDRYQLVHDYLVRYVRNVQTPELMAELTSARRREREALPTQPVANGNTALFWAQKNEALEQRLKWQQRATTIIGIGLGIVTVLGLLAYAVTRVREYPRSQFEKGTIQIFTVTPQALIV